MAGEGTGQGILLGIDIGGTKLNVALGRVSGDLIREARIDDWASGDAKRDLDRIAQTARDLLTAARLDARELAAIGVSAPGPLDPSTGTVRDAPNLPGWHEVPISAQLARAFGRRENWAKDTGIR